MITSNFLSAYFQENEGSLRLSFDVPKIEMSDFWRHIKSAYAKRLIMLGKLEAFEGGESRDEEPNFAILQIAKTQQINQALWELIQQYNAEGELSPAVEIDREKFQAILLAIAIASDTSKPSGADIIDQLGWAMLSYAAYYCRDEPLRKALLDTVESYLVMPGMEAVSAERRVTFLEDTAERLFLLGQADFRPSAGFLAPMMASTDSWVLFSILACPRISADLLKSVITRDFEDNVFNVLDELTSFKHFSLLSEEDGERLSAVLIKLGVYDGPAATGYKLLCSFLEDAEQSMAGAARTFEEKAIAIFSVPGRLSELCQIDTQEYSGEFLASVFDTFSDYFSLRFYRVIFSQFNMSKNAVFSKEKPSQKVQDWVFSFKFMREFTFLKGEVPLHEVLEIIVGLNNPSFNEALFSANEQLGFKDYVTHDVRAIKSSVGEDSKPQVYPLFIALTSFKPRENASRQFLIGLKQLMVTMLFEQSFKVENYYPHAKNQFFLSGKAVSSISIKASAKDSKANVSHSSFFNSLSEVTLAIRLYRLICKERLVESDYLPLAYETIDVELIESALQTRYVNEIYQLIEHQKMLMDFNKPLPGWVAMATPETKKVVEETFKKRLAAIFAIVAQLPIENVIRLHEKAPHFVMLSMAHNIYQCIAALNVQKGRRKSMPGGILNRLKGSSGDNKQARVRLLTYISNHLAEALVPAGEGEIPFLFSAYYFIELKPNKFMIENACPGVSQEQQMAARQAIAAEQVSAQKYYVDNRKAMVNDVQQWLREIIFVASASTLPLITKPLALLPNDYLSGLLYLSGYAVQEIRRMALPQYVVVDTAVLDKQETFIRATMAMADASIEEDLKGGVAMDDDISVAAYIARVDGGDLYAAANGEDAVSKSPHIEL